MTEQFDLTDLVGSDNTIQSPDVINLFPTPLWKLDYNEDYDIPLDIQEFYKWAINESQGRYGKFKEGMAENKVFNRGGFHSYYCNDFNVVPNISYLHSKLSFLPSYNLQEWWLNVDKKGNYILPHTHSNADLSIIWYLTDNNKSLTLEHPLRFNRTKLFCVTNDMSFDPFGKGPQSKTDFMLEKAIDCKAGDIVVFPGDIQQSHTPHTNNTPRISIQFNLRF